MYTEADWPPSKTKVKKLCLVWCVWRRLCWRSNSGKHLTSELIFIPETALSNIQLVLMHINSLSVSWTSPMGHTAFTCQASGTYYSTQDKERTCLSVVSVPYGAIFPNFSTSRVVCLSYPLCDESTFPKFRPIALMSNTGHVVEGMSRKLPH